MVTNNNNQTSHYQESVHRLLQFPKFGAGIGLHRMSWILAQILEKFPEITFDAIKITGSNGKGSTCVFLSAIMAEMGVTNGLYTSPHLVRFNERIKIDGKDIGDDELLDAISWIEHIIKKYNRRFPNDVVGGFEAFTGLALYHFAQQDVETVILEAGIGGRYDSTRVVSGNLVALTSLDLEHTELLGKTLEEIAYDKMDLCREGGTLVLGQVDSEILRRIKAVCQLKNLRLLVVNEECQVKNLRYHQQQMIMDVGLKTGGLKDVVTNLVGPHQINNLCISILLAQEWCKINCPNFSKDSFEEAVKRGLSRARWQGRFEKIHSEPDIYIDVGHTPAAIEACFQTVKSTLTGRKLLLVIGVSYNKDREGIVSRLVTIADEVICTRAYHNGSAVSEIEKIVKEKRPTLPCLCAETIEMAISLAMTRAKERGMTVLVAGSLFLSIEAQQAINNNDPKSLKFW